MAKQLKTLFLKDIRFTQDSIASGFSDYTFESTAAALKEGRLEMGDNPGQLPRISVVNLGGFHFSLDNRRLYCLLLAFGDEPNREVSVWENTMSRKLEKELVWKFSTGLSLKVRGQSQDNTLKTLEWNNTNKKGKVDYMRKDPKLKQGETSASAFLARYLTDEQIDAARSAVREEYEEQLARLKEEADEKDRLLTRYRDQTEDTDEDIGMAVHDCLRCSGYLDEVSILHTLPRPPSMLQLKRVLNQLLDARRVMCKGVDEASFRYGLPDAPWANTELEVAREDGLWTITSSVAKRFHPDIDGPSLSKQSAYVGCTLSSHIIGSNASAVLRLSGDWAKDDKLLFGVWPSGTNVDDRFCAPGPTSHQKDLIDHAPGFWISCSSGYILSSGNVFSPQDWKPPPKVSGARWGLLLSSSGQLQFASAHPEEPLEWRELKWNGDPDLSMNPAGLAIAVLLQPRNRRGSKAQLAIEEIGYCDTS